MQNKDQSHQNSTIKNQFEDLTDSLVIDPSLIWFVLLKYKKILLLVPIVIACIVYFFTKSLIPTYQSNASLIYNNDSSNIVEISEVYDQASINNQNEINTQISVLKSREILKRILNKSEEISDINNLSTLNKENFISKTFSLIGVNFFAPKEMSKEALFSQLFGSMTVSQTRSSNVINITLEANVPEQAKKSFGCYSCYILRV